MSGALDWLYARQRFGMRPGLGRVRALLERLDDPQRAFRSVLVGGTNGKGSTAASLAAMLSAGRQRTALFTSPHLTRFAERFVVDGRELPGAQVLAVLEAIRPHAEALEASFFEVVTALACVLFAEAGAETAVMEVGLGGRLDATNALDPALSVVTSIGLDHTEILGHTVEAIAAEKAGILRAGRPGVTGASGPALGVLEGAGADLWALGREASVEAEPLRWDGWAVTLRSPIGEQVLRTPLLGRHGANNAALAALAAQRLGLPAEAIAAGAAGVRWPGRLERLPWRGGWVLLDGAHNPDGARALRETLQALGLGRVPLIFGTSGDKDLAGLAAELAPIAREVIVTRALLSPRAADPEGLAALWPVPVRVAGTPRAALDLLPPGGLAVACGSLYLVGELRPILLGEADEGRERWQ